MKSCIYCKTKYPPANLGHSGYCSSKCKNNQGAENARVRRAQAKVINGLVQKLICARWSKINYDYEAVI